MKRLATIFVSLLLVGSVWTPSPAQVVSIVRDARSDRTRDVSGSTWQVYSGLRVVGKGSTVYLIADTTGSGSTAVTSFAWTFLSKPTGSAVAFTDASGMSTKFMPDSVGQYIVQVSANGAVTAQDTFFASVYVGMGNKFPQCGFVSSCHGDKVTTWTGTGHAKIFTEGITGQLEVNVAGKGMYSPICTKCHTTAGDPTLNNGNFGYLAHQTGWDTTWYKPYAKSGISYLIPYQDSTAYNQLTTTPAYSALVPLAKIGCEACHGPGANHMGDATKIGVSYDAGVCQTCHDAPPHHTKGTEWTRSAHATWEFGKLDANRTSCFPCHSGSAFAKWIDAGRPSSVASYADNSDIAEPLTCAGCHDPHSDANPHQLRTMNAGSLNNGYVIPPSTQVGGMGQICMNCHKSRYGIAARVKPTSPPYYGFVNHYGPHGNPQADMFFGQNAWQFGDSSLTGLATHLGVTDACVTCHMPDGNHEWAMQDTLGNDKVAACQTCHGQGVTKFEDIMALYDYDHNGKIEGAMTEVEGLLDKLKAKIASEGGIDAVTGEPTLDTKDSLAVKNNFSLVAEIYDYTFVKNDGSMGAHNTKYAVSILQKALGYYPTFVNKVDQKVPTTFELAQNYPNPFNPTTTIGFSLPHQEYVVLIVYDMLGHEVNRLVDGEMSPGTFKVTWNGDAKNGAKVSSGVYFYRLHAGSFNTVKKMLMLK
jgi:hypothetical protein